MKRALVILPILFALAILPAFAQNQMIAVNIPFDFSVRNQVLPAGEYTISEVTATGGWIVRSVENNKAAVFVVLPHDYTRAAQPKLVFHRYGRDNFLTQIWTSNRAVALPQSKREMIVLAKAGRPVTVSLLIKR